MKHHKKGRKLGRKRSQRKALLQNLAKSLVLHSRLQTTEAKAKELRPYIERLITKAREGEKTAIRRLIVSRLGNDKKAAQRLIDEVAPTYKERQGGYTRITKLPTKREDAAPQAVIEFV